MFSNQDFKQLSTSYFTILSAASQGIVLESRNTHHQWRILCKRREENGKIIESLELWHQHTARDSYHLQERVSSIKEATSKIRAHDRYFLDAKRQKDIERRERHRNRLCKI